MQKTKYAPLVCFFIFLFIYGITSRANLQITDETAVFSSGVSLATKGSLHIDSLQWLQAEANLGHIGPDGHLYAKYFPGNILGVAFVYKLSQKANDVPYIWYGYEPNPQPHVLAESNFGARLALRWNALLGSLGVAALYAILLRRFDWKTATVTALLFGLSTDWWYQSRGLFSEIGAGTFLILCLYFADAEKPALSGLSLGLSLLFRQTNLLGIPIVVYGIWKKGYKSAWTGIFVILGVCVLAIYNWLRFKSILDFGYVNEHFNNSIARGLVEVLLSPGRSIFFYSPLLILCISGIQAFIRKDKWLTGTLLIVIIGYILAASLWHDSDGGTSWGSRLITPVLPLLGFLLAPMVEKAFSLEPEKTRFYISLLAGLGLCIQLLTLTANPILALVNYVGPGRIPYGDTIRSFQDSWLSLQIRNLEHWNPCNMDSYTLQRLFTKCR